MEKKNLTLSLLIAAAIFFYTFINTPLSASSETGTNTFSFHFENCTLNEALKQISEKSGINIISNSAFKKEILRKSYANMSLDTIITDLLRGENCAVVWNYEEDNLLSVDLYTYDKDDVKKTVFGPERINTTSRNYGGRVPSGNINTREINGVNNKYLKTGKSISRKGSNPTVSASPGPAAQNTSKTIDRKNQTVSGTSKRIDSRKTSVSGAPGESADIRRVSINKQDRETVEEEEAVKTEPSPEPPKPARANRLEPPPMPPGL